jgi:hypothetical protein
MAELESQQTNAPTPSEPLPHDEANGAGTLSTHGMQIPNDSQDDPLKGGISVVPVPRREIARLHGTFRLSELPRHKPTIVFDASRQFRDTDDE